MLLTLPLVVLAFVISFVMTAAMKRIAPRVGFVDKPGHRKIHHTPKPLGGGVAIFLGIFLPLAGGLLYCNIVPPPPDTSIPAAPVVSGHAEVPGGSGRNSAHHWDPVRRATAADVWTGVRNQTPLALKILIAMALIHAIGLWDDRRALGPLSKLAAQFAITGWLAVSADLRALTFLDDLGFGIWPSVIASVLWISAITNAFNFLDNMDGLSAGVAAISATAFLITTILIGQWAVAAMLALLLGALLGFLCFNFPPASIFMGDSGSLVIGLLLGILTIRTIYLPLRPDHTFVQFSAGWYAVFTPLIVLAVPLYDLVVVSGIRIRRGRSPFVGDTNHLSHRLVARGMSRRTAVLCIYLITAATSVAAVILPQVQSTFAAAMIMTQTVLILGVVMLLEQHPLPAAPDIAEVQRPEPPTAEYDGVEPPHPPAERPVRATDHAHR